MNKQNLEKHIKILEAKVSALMYTLLFVMGTLRPIYTNSELQYKPNFFAYLFFGLMVTYGIVWGYHVFTSNTTFEN